MGEQYTGIRCLGYGARAVNVLSVRSEDQSQVKVSPVDVGVGGGREGKELVAGTFWIRMGRWSEGDLPGMLHRNRPWARGDMFHFTGSARPSSPLKFQ